jgi:RHS repeat-associated protein
VDTFDGAGDVTQETAPAPAGQSGHETTTYTYDGNGNLLTINGPPVTTGGSDQVTVDTYSSTGELVTQTTGYGTSSASTVSYCYDPDGNKTSVVYADGNTSGTATCETSSPWVVSATSFPAQAGAQTTYSHDSIGEVVSTTTPATAMAPSGAMTTATYDPLGNKLTSTDPDGITTTWTYTPLNQIATISYSASSAHSVSYTYDADGDKTAMTDATGSSSYIYDQYGDLTSATNGAGQTTGYGYNADGILTSITYPLPTSATWATSDTVNYTVDDANYLTSVTDFTGNRISIGNTADGVPDSLVLASSGDEVNTTYDNTDAPSLIKLTSGTTTLQSFSYSYAPAGNILSETDSPSSSQSPAAYTYDADGRISSMTPGTEPTADYGFDASSNLTTLPNGASGAYDNAGELTSSTLSGTTLDYAYNADGERLSAKQGSTTVESATWNGAGELDSYSTPMGNLTAAAYDGTGLRASVSTGTGSQDFTWANVGDAPQLIMDSSNAYVYSGGDVPVEQVSLATGVITYLMSDALGSVRGTVNSSGSLTASTSYDAWGNPETVGGLTSVTPFGYAGGYTDPTGLIYLINRYYDPETGQFISMDPDLPQTLEPYEYALGDPVNHKDLSGLDPSGLIGVFACNSEADEYWADQNSVIGAYGEEKCTGQGYSPIKVTIALERHSFLWIWHILEKQSSHWVEGGRKVHHSVFYDCIGTGTHKYRAITDAYAAGTLNTTDTTPGLDFTCLND